jgi:hypothetical protein
MARKRTRYDLWVFYKPSKAGPDVYDKIVKAGTWRAKTGSGCGHGGCDISFAYTSLPTLKKRMRAIKKAHRSARLKCFDFDKGKFVSCSAIGKVKR